MQNNVFTLSECTQQDPQSFRSQLYPIVCARIRNGVHVHTEAWKSYK